MFIALGLCIWQDSDLIEQMRLWIVDRLMTFPKCYNVFGTKEKFTKHCDKMARKGTPGSYLEL